MNIISILLNVAGIVLTAILIVQGIKNTKVTLVKGVYGTLGIALLFGVLMALGYHRALVFTYSPVMFLISVIVFRFYLVNEAVRELGIEEGEPQSKTVIGYYFVPVPLWPFIMKITGDKKTLFIRFWLSLWTMAMVCCMIYIFYNSVSNGIAWFCMIAYAGMLMYLMNTYRKGIHDEARMHYFKITSVYMIVILIRSLLEEFYFLLG